VDDVHVGVGQPSNPFGQVPDGDGLAGADVVRLADPSVVAARRFARTTSSTNTKSRVCVPSPWTVRSSPASACWMNVVMTPL
jgi:hypothetical protein